MLITAQVSDAKRAGSREERQAHSSNTSGLKQMHALGGAHDSPADAKAASSAVKAEAQPDGVNSPSAFQKPGGQGQLVTGAVPGSVPAGTEDNAASVEIAIQTDTVMKDARPEPGEINNAEGEVAIGSGLTVKLAVRVNGDETAGASPDVVLPMLRLRDRYVFHNRGAEGPRG